MTLSEHQKAVDAFFKKMEKQELVKDISFGNIVKKYDKIIARVEGLKKASQALARAYQNALNMGKSGKNQGKYNLEALNSLDKALAEYIRLVEEVNTETADMPVQASNLRAAADKEYAEELARLDALRNNAKNVLNRIQDDMTSVHREAALDKAAAEQLKVRVRTLVDNKGLDFIHAVPHDELLFKIENLK